MSPKAFRLVDALGASKKSEKQDFEPGGNAAPASAAGRKCGENSHLTTNVKLQKHTKEAKDDPLEAALLKAQEFLGYGAMSSRRLSQKLLQRGFGEGTVEAAIDYLQDHGFMREGEDAVRFAEQGVRKLWGPRRIREDLYARRFSETAIEEAMENLETLDFETNCAKVITKKYGCVPDDLSEIKKMMAALMRMGYTVTQIKAAMRLLKSDE